MNALDCIISMLPVIVLHVLILTQNDHFNTPADLQVVMYKYTCNHSHCSIFSAKLDSASFSQIVYSAHKYIP